MQVIWCLKFCNMTKSGGTIPPRSKLWGDLSPPIPPVIYAHANATPNISPIGLIRYTASRKRCNIGAMLLSFTPRKSHMRFSLVPKFVTLNDFIRRHSCYFAFLSFITPKQHKHKNTKQHMQ